MSKDKINPSHYKDDPIQTCNAITPQVYRCRKDWAIKFNICKCTSCEMGKKVETLDRVEMVCLVIPVTLREVTQRTDRYD